MREVAIKAGRYYPVTVRWQTPQPKQKGKVPSGAGLKGNLRHQPSVVRAVANDRRGRVVEFMDSKCGEWVSPGEIRDAVGLGERQLRRVLAGLRVNGVVEWRGAPGNARRYRRV